MKKFSGGIVVSCLVLLIGSGTTQTSSAQTTCSTLSVRAIEAKPAQAKKVRWKKFVSAIDKFSVLMPGVPQKKTVGVPGSETRTYVLKAGKVSYVVASQTPETLLDKKGKNLSAEGILNSNLQGYLSFVGSRLKSQRKIVFQGHLGRELIVVMTDKKTQSKDRVIFARGRMYSFSFIAPIQGFSNKSADVFLKSFTFLK